MQSGLQLNYTCFTPPPPTVLSWLTPPPIKFGPRRTSCWILPPASESNCMSNWELIWQMNCSTQVYQQPQPYLWCNFCDQLLMLQWKLPAIGWRCHYDVKNIYGHSELFRAYAQALSLFQLSFKSRSYTLFSKVLVLKYSAIRLVVCIWFCELFAALCIYLQRDRHDIDYGWLTWLIRLLMVN